MVDRYLVPQVVRDLDKKMVLVGGPRQVGKTTLAKALLSKGAGYLNWDIAEDREAILRRTLPATPVLAFDEFHKYRSWRNYLKGLYDGGRRRIIVTGSARLDFYRFGGDSLQGRYHYLRLHPFSAAELKISSSGDWESLLSLGGFPEPFLSGSEIEAKRWSREHRTRLLREDLADLERIEDLGNLELLVLRLPELVGSPLSVNALREDLRLSFRTVSKWLDALERMYALFRVGPFGPPKVRAVKKERKHYHFDWSVVPDQAARFENMVGSHLLKWVHFEQDAKGRDLDLRYYRDVHGREVDFVVLEGPRQPILAVECKWDDGEPGSGIKYFRSLYPRCPAWQVSASGRLDYATRDGIRVAPALRLLNDLI